MAQPLQLSRIEAVMLGVRDLPQAIAFYRDKLGLEVAMQESALALMKCGEMMLGLSLMHVRFAPQVTGATEVVFAVPDVRAARKALAEKGVAFLDEPRQITPTDFAVHFKDVDGHLLSLFGPEGKA